jgi:hypothetical protein
MYTKIEIDFDVFKELTSKRDNESVSYNDVLRLLLGLESNQANVDKKKERISRGKAWTVKRVTFPHGTEFRASYQGREYNAVVDDGALVFEGKRYTSPSPAAMAITNNSVNGWVFWECRFPGTSQWTSMNRYRAGELQL